MKEHSMSYELHVDDFSIQCGEMTVHTTEGIEMQVWVGEEFGIRPDLNIRYKELEVVTMEGSGFSLNKLGADHDKFMTGTFQNVVHVDDGRNDVYLMRGKLHDHGEINARLVREGGFRRILLITVDWRD